MCCVLYLFKINPVYLTLSSMEMYSLLFWNLSLFQNYIVINFNTFVNLSQVWNTFLTVDSIATLNSIGVSSPPCPSPYLSIKCVWYPFFQLDYTFFTINPYEVKTVGTDDEYRKNRTEKTMRVGNVRQTRKPLGYIETWRCSDVFVVDNRTMTCERYTGAEKEGETNENPCTRAM